MHLYPDTALDFYKTGHIFQYPPRTQYVYSNWTCRSTRWANVLPDFDHKTVFFGLQGICQWLLRDLWNDRFFSLPKKQVLARYKRRMDAALGDGVVSIDHIAALHDLGYLPLSIKALPEGCRVDVRVPLFTMINTHPDFYWVTNYLETQISCELWKVMTSATLAFEYRRLLDQRASTTGTDPAFVPWQGHDFSFRGLSGITDAAQSGAGHLLSFTGTDTVSAIDYLEDYYGGAADGRLIGGSVPATEHSVMCAGGCETELETFRQLITNVYPSGVVSIVSDTWDFWNVVTNLAAQLKYVIMSRNGKLVFRPDSGDPVKIICGDPATVPGTPTFKGAVECLWELFGGTVTPTGHRLLDSHVGLIYGDSISLQRAQAILDGLASKGFASGNIVFGIGSYTYQYVTRDTLGTAIKATWAVIDDHAYDLYKDPKTDNGIKKSACGLLRVEFEDDHFVLYDRQTTAQEESGLLRKVFHNGELTHFESLHTIRKRLTNGGRP